MSLSRVTGRSSRSTRSVRKSPPSRPGTFVAMLRRPVSSSTTAGTPTTAESIRCAGRPDASTREVRSFAIVSSAFPTSTSGSSTSWRARTAPDRSQIAPRRNRAPMSTPSTSAASGTASKKTAPYRVRPTSGSVSRTRPDSSKDWSARETVGFEMPACREISAREIGAALRIVSSTVRSFSCLRSGGIAARGRVTSTTLTKSRDILRLDFLLSTVIGSRSFGNLTNGFSATDRGGDWDETRGHGDRPARADRRRRRRRVGGLGVDAGTGRRRRSPPGSAGVPATSSRSSRRWWRSTTRSTPTST